MKCDLKIFTENIEAEAVNQIYNLIVQPPFEEAKIRIMPDVHYGKGCVVGFTSTLNNKLIPNVLGVDLGCGMLTIELGNIDIKLSELDELIKKKIPYGSEVHKEMYAEKLIKSLKCFNKLTDLQRLYGSLGTLGGGNHFIEIDCDNDDNKYLIIHSGSRNLGLQVAKIYQKLAIEYCKNSGLDEKEKAINELKSQGKIGKIPQVIDEINVKFYHKTKIPNNFCYLEGDILNDYFHDLKICQKFASLNRTKIAEVILKFLKVNRYTSFETIHNFIAEDNIIRKGAIPAYKGEKVLIPMNMRDGCIIAIGKGNEDWNNSAPHGAGRLYKRSDVKQFFTVDDFQKQMNGIYTSTANESTLDESPMAYKHMDEIISLISPTVEILKVIKPIYNFKS